MINEKEPKISKKVFAGLLRREGVTKIAGLGNPVKIGTKFAIVYLLYKNTLHECLVDPWDLGKIAFGCTWVAATRKTSDRYYARAFRNGTVITMHRLITDSDNRRIVHHIDGNGLNNRRNNLEVTSQGINMLSQIDPVNNTSGERNIAYRNGYYFININYKFKNKELAIMARDIIRGIALEYLKQDIEERDDLK